MLSRALLTHARTYFSPRTQPLDLSLQFLLSKEGAFVRAAAMSDLRRAAQSSLRSRLSWRWIFRERRRPSADGAVSANEGRREQTKNPMHHGDDKDEEVREASRRALQQRVLVAARRKPALAARANAMVVAAAGMVRWVQYSSDEVSVDINARTQGYPYRTRLSRAYSVSGMSRPWKAVATLEGCRSRRRPGFPIISQYSRPRESYTYKRDSVPFDTIFCPY